MEDINYDDLDPGIRETVRQLRAEGWDTTDSGDGVSKGEQVPAEGTTELPCAISVPNVTILVEPLHLVPEARRLATFLARRGVHLCPIDESVDSDTPSLQASYDPADDSAVISLFNVVLSSQEPS